MIFPIGRYAGATGDGRHQVCAGGRSARLDATTFAAWGLAHGPVDPVLAAAVPWTREELERYAGLAGLAEPARLVTGLLDQELLAQTPASGPDAVAFARTHRAVPLAVGLGNGPETPQRYAIGLTDRVLVEVDERRYDVWCWSTVYPTLWDVCQARAPETGAAGPAELLGHFLAGAHQLAAATALYLEPA